MFADLKLALQKQFQTMCNNNVMLFETSIGKDIMWETYLNSFPDGTNLIYKERTKHDCNCCKQFIRACGNVVAIQEGQVITIWDVVVNDPTYQVVTDAMSKVVKLYPVSDVFVYKFNTIGTDTNQQQLEDKTVKTWSHFFVNVPKTHVNKSSESIEEIQGKFRDGKNVFQRALEEFQLSDVRTVLELIDSNSIYRGAEFKGILQQFEKYLIEYKTMIYDAPNNFCWKYSVEAGQALSRIRNSAIGTLLIDISKGVEIDVAVNSFERIMAPTNYKRPTAIVTKSMIEGAEKKVSELGLVNALGRRFATIEDITINNVLYANRDSKSKMSVFDDMKSEVAINPRSFSKIEEIGIQDFMDKILPNSKSIQVLLENRATSNLMSLIAPIDADANSLFKWNNGFSWAYNNDVADSIKEKVKTAGGRVEGELRISLAWYNFNDLDLHLIEPSGNRIYFGNKLSKTGGVLDVDMNAGSGSTREPVENIIFSNKNNMLEGEYQIIVNNYTYREASNPGFAVEMEHNGDIYDFSMKEPLRNGYSIVVAKFTYSKTTGIVIKEHIEMNAATITKDIWGLKTNQFQTVSVLMHSPNHWDGQSVGNKHYFFMLQDCINPNTPRGFFNEFLKEDLMEQKRVFELLGSKMKVEPSTAQLSGLGFSSTNKDSLICKVDGAFSRTVKIKF